MNDTTIDLDVPSPCTGICKLDPHTGWCNGCRRTRDEIAGWRTFDSAAKRAVLARVSVRGMRREG